MMMTTDVASTATRSQEIIHSGVLPFLSYLSSASFALLLCPARFVLTFASGTVTVEGESPPIIMHS
jgi:hypothetical protein